MFKKLKHEIKSFIIDELLDLQCWAEQELNLIRSKQGQKNKEFSDKIDELKEGEIQDLELLDKYSRLALNLEKKVDLLSSRFELWKEIHRENMMLLMEYLGVYLDVENDKKVIKKEKKK